MAEGSFEWALGELKKGHWMARKSWEFRITNICIYKNDKQNELPYLEMLMANQKYIPYVASNEDILADDWFCHTKN